MIRGTSYRTKRRKINNELYYLKSSKDDTILSLPEVTTCGDEELLNNDSNEQSCSPRCSLGGISSSNLDQNCQLIKNNNTNSNNNNTFKLPTSDQENNFINNNVDHDYNGIIKENLGKWAINFNVPQNAVNALLKILKYDANMKFLPKDSRTLLNSKSSTLLNMHEVIPGNYYHFGLATGIIRYSSLISFTDVIKISIGIDGLPLTKSSSSQFWLIFNHTINMFFLLVFIMGMKNQRIVMIFSNI